MIGTTTRPRRVGDLEARGIKPAVIDVADESGLHTLLSDRQAVYLTIAPKARRQDYSAVYLAGVRNLAQAAEDTAVSRFVYTSSTRVYGQDDGSWVDESSPT